MPIGHLVVDLLANCLSVLDEDAKPAIPCFHRTYRDTDSKRVVVLCRAKLVSRSWRAAARHVLTNMTWQTERLTVHELLKLKAPTVSVVARIKKATTDAMACSSMSSLTIFASHAALLLPLHACAANEAAPAVASALLDAYPAAVKHATETIASDRYNIFGGDSGGNDVDDGCLPLHYAAAHTACELARLLIKAFPAGARVRNRVGDLPLHMVAFASCRRGDRKPVEPMEPIVRALLEVYPGAAQEPCVLHRGSKAECACTPLRALLHRGASAGVLRLLLAAHPESARTPAQPETHDREPGTLFSNLPDTDVGLLPLHEALGKLKRASNEEERARIMWPLPTLEEVEAGIIELLRSYPEAAAVPVVGYASECSLVEPRDDKLPVHDAVAHGSAGLVAALLEAHPLSDSWSLVDCIMARGYGEAEVLRRLSGDTAAARQLARTAVGRNGRLPLHYACIHGASATVLARLVHLHVGALLEPDATGRLPIHHASNAYNRASAEGIAPLQIDGRLAGLATSVQAAPPREFVTEGYFPLHVAAHTGAPLEVLQLLVAANPAALTVQAMVSDNCQHKLPLELVLGRGKGHVDPAAVTALLEAAPEVARPDSPHLHGGNCSLLISALHAELSDAVLLALLKADPTAARRPNSMGWLPLHEVFYRSNGPHPPSAPLVSALLAAHPAALHARARWEWWEDEAPEPETPLDFALHANAGPEVVATLLAAEDWLEPGAHGVAGLDAGLKALAACEPAQAARRES